MNPRLLGVSIALAVVALGCGWATLHFWYGSLNSNFSWRYRDRARRLAELFFILTSVAAILLLALAIVSALSR